MSQHTLLWHLVAQMDAGIDEAVARQDAKAKAKAARLDWEREQAGYDIEDDDAAIRECSCIDMIARVEAGTLDAIFTDPPYPKEFIGCWDDLAKFAVHALRPGGVLLTMVPHHLMFEIGQRLNIEGLTYRWVVAYNYEKARTNINSAKVSVGWKPWIAFTRDGAHPQHYSQDSFPVPPRLGSDKDDHDWGQNEQGVQDVAAEWLRPGWKVCDPFCGAGAMLVGAKNTGCHVIGCDIDAAHVKTTLAKLEAE